MARKIAKNVKDRLCAMDGSRASNLPAEMPVNPNVPDRRASPTQPICQNSIFQAPMSLAGDEIDRDQFVVPNPIAAALFLRAATAPRVSPVRTSIGF